MCFAEFQMYLGFEEEKEVWFFLSYGSAESDLLQQKFEFRVTKRCFKKFFEIAKGFVFKYFFSILIIERISTTLNTDLNFFSSSGLCGLRNLSLKYFHLKFQIIIFVQNIFQSRSLNGKNC